MRDLRIVIHEQDAASAEPECRSGTGLDLHFLFGARVFSAVSDAEDPSKIQSWVDSGVKLEVGLGELGLSPLALPRQFASGDDVEDVRSQLRDRAKETFLSLANQ